MTEDLKKKLIVKETFEISVEAFEELIEFLLAREHDIAIDWENIGTLRNVFKELIGKEPERSD